MEMNHGDAIKRCFALKFINNKIFIWEEWGNANDHKKIPNVYRW
jgi:hypothetical protein